MIIKFSTPCCGRVEVVPAAVRVVLCKERELSYIAVTCPLCESRRYMPAEDDAVNALAIPGVEFELWVMPEENSDTAAKPPVNIIDIERFQRDIKDVDRLAAAASTYFPEEYPPPL